MIPLTHQGHGVVQEDPLDSSIPAQKNWPGRQQGQGNGAILQVQTEGYQSTLTFRRRVAKYHRVSMRCPKFRNYDISQSTLLSKSFNLSFFWVSAYLEWLTSYTSLSMKILQQILHSFLRCYDCFGLSGIIFICQKTKFVNFQLISLNTP